MKKEYKDILFKVTKEVTIDALETAKNFVRYNIYSPANNKWVTSTYEIPVKNQQDSYVLYISNIKFFTSLLNTILYKSGLNSEYYFNSKCFSDFNYSKQLRNNMSNQTEDDYKILCDFVCDNLIPIENQ